MSMPAHKYGSSLSRALVLMLMLVGICISHVWAGEAKEPTHVSTQIWFYAQTEGASPTDPIVKLMKDNPDIRVTNWSGINLPGAAGRTPLMMAIAGQTAPDLFVSWFHLLRTDVGQGFTYPLNEWIGNDSNGDGEIDPDTEAKWDGWKNVPALWRRVATVDGKIQALPMSTTNYFGILYRTDLVRQAGLDPNRPPKTWDEFLYWCQKLTDPGKNVPGAKMQRGQRGFALAPEGWKWLPWVASTGGSPVIQIKESPTTHKKYTFPMEATTFITPDTHEDLSIVPSEWRADLASEAAQRATAFYHRLRWQRWVRDPQTSEPINLTPAQAKAGKVTLADGRALRFKEKQVIKGAVLPIMASSGDDPTELLARGETAMALGSFNNLADYKTKVNPDLLGAFAIPAGPGGKPVVQIQRHFIVMGDGVGRRSRHDRDIVWKVLTAATSQASFDDKVNRMVLSGQARFVNPKDLQRLGYGEYIKNIPTSLRNLYADIDGGAILTRTEPFAGFWMTMDVAVNNNVNSLTIAETGENFNFKKGLAEVNQMANTGQMFQRKPEELKPYRPLAWVVFLLAASVVLFFVTMIIRSNIKMRAAGGAKSRAGVYAAWLPWIMLVPALGTIALWGYYPLARGVMMAFQDYHIVGKSGWVGLDNFINIFLNPDFYLYIKQTVKFVVLTMAFAFPMPILLALLLSEIPWAKVFWRSVFFLPQLTSGLVVVLLWKLLYSPLDTGMLNQLMHLLHLQSHDWLGDPKLAMMATIIPGIWAGMGMSSLIYLAALKGIPEELYEAADLDGASVLHKLWYITVPQLLPLIVINFVGAFIGTFQSMGNIFLLTFGGPGKETTVMSFAIWLEAYNNLRFSTATAMAWIMGSALIGFAYLQIRILRKVEFRRAEGV